MEILCRYLSTVESCVMLNILCHLSSRIYHYENFYNTRTLVSLRFVAVFLTKFWNLIALGTLYRPCKFRKNRVGTFRNGSKRVRTVRDVSERFQTCWNVSKRFETCQNGSKRVGTFPDVLERVGTF